MPAPEQSSAPDDRPPFLGTWRNVYIALLLYLALLIALLGLFTRAYAV